MPDPDDEPRQELPAEAPAAAADEAPPSGRPVSEESAELYFLIANFLTNASPCSRAAAVLQQELVCDAQQLLRDVPDTDTGVSASLHVPVTTSV